MGRANRGLLRGLILGLSLAHLPSANAQWYSFERSLPNPGAIKLGYGKRIASDGDAVYALTDLGFVYRFDVTTGSVTSFTAPDAVDFQPKIATGSGLVAVTLEGSRQPPPSVGGVNVFDGTTGALLRTLEPDPAGPFENEAFGLILLSSGSRLIAGPAHDAQYYVFDWTTGALVSKIPYPGGGHETVAGDFLYADASGFPFHHLYVYDLSSGTLLADHPISGSLAGTLGGHPVVLDNGVLRQLDRDTGAVLQSFPDPAPMPNDHFGGAVADAGGLLVVSSDVDGSGGTGAVYAFDAATGALVQTVRSLAAAPLDDSFGFRLAVAGTRLVVSAPTRETAAMDVYDACGDGVRVAGEQCDDGNVAAGDGCSATCRLELCGPAPAAGCRRTAAGQSRLVLVNKSRDKQDTITWTWKRGAATAPDFGSPTSTTSYALCVYDGSASPQPLLRPAALAGTACGTPPCWTSSTGKFGYSSPGLMPDGMSKITLRATASGGTISVKAKGTPLDAPTLPRTLPVTVQLRNTDTGVCFEASYAGAVSSNDTLKFVAASDP